MQHLLDSHLRSGMVMRRDEVLGATSGSTGSRELMSGLQQRVLSPMKEGKSCGMMGERKEERRDNVD